MGLIGLVFTSGRAKCDCLQCVISVAMRHDAGCFWIICSAELH